MNILLKDDDELTIQVLSFDKPSENSERFYFLEMSTLQATILLHQDIKINSAAIVSYTHDDKYLDDQTIAGFTTIGKFNTFYLTNEDYYIANCCLKLDNGISISSHDDGEVSIEFVSNKGAHTLIEKIFKKYNIDQSLVEAIKNKPGYYFSIDGECNIVAEYKTFNEYVEREIK